MKLRADEKIIANIKRHKTPFCFSMIKLVIVFMPFYFLTYFVGKELSDLYIFIFFLTVSLFFGFFIVYISLIYFLDRLIITTQRIILINWKSLFRREEYEAELVDIQDIRTREKGFLSKFKILDYGILEIETASSSTTIKFENTPDPEGVKHFIFSHQKKYIIEKS